MNTPTRILLLICAAALTSCTSQPKTTSHKKLKLETIDHGPDRPKTYLYREVDN
jgi:hypothetical protein